MRTAARALTIIIAVASWVALSNHCAFAAANSQPAAEQGVCPFHGKPAKPKPARSDVQCCKILRAVTTAPIKRIARAIVELAHVDFAFGAFVLVDPAQIAIVPETLDTGPPGTTSFSELIGSWPRRAPPLHA